MVNSHQSSPNQRKKNPKLLFIPTACHKLEYTAMITFTCCYFLPVAEQHSLLIDAKNICCWKEFIRLERFCKDSVKYQGSQVVSWYVPPVWWWLDIGNTHWYMVKQRTSPVILYVILSALCQFLKLRKYSHILCPEKMVD